MMVRDTTFMVYLQSCVMLEVYLMFMMVVDQEAIGQWIDDLKVGLQFERLHQSCSRPLKDMLSFCFLTFVTKC